jgi:hypothetical protein
LSELQKNFKVVLSAYPGIAEKIKLFWGYPEFTTLMDDLMNNTRDHQRAGFPMDVYSAFWELKERHDQAFPELAKNQDIGWTLNYRA